MLAEGQHNFQGKTKHVHRCVEKTETKGNIRRGCTVAICAIPYAIGRPFVFAFQPGFLKHNQFEFIVAIKPIKRYKHVPPLHLLARAMIEHRYDTYWQLCR